MFKTKYSISDIKETIDLLHSKTQVDFNKFSDFFALRRIIEFAEAEKIASLPDLNEHLQKSDVLRAHLADSFFVSSSELFRDAETLNYLQQKIFPKLFQKEQLKISIPTCIGGEELQNILYLADMPESVNATLFVSYPFERNLETIQKLVWNAADLKACKKNIELLNKAQDIEDVFIKEGEKYIIKRHFKGKLHFEHRIIFAQKQHHTFDLVLFRNRLIYYKKEASNEILRTLTDSLKPRGLLLLGEKETLGDFSRKYKIVKKGLPLYRKKRFV